MLKLEELLYYARRGANEVWSELDEEMWEYWEKHDHEKVDEIEKAKAELIMKRDDISLLQERFGKSPKLEELESLMSEIMEEIKKINEA